MSVKLSALQFDVDLDRQPDQAVLFGGEYYICLGGRSVEYAEGGTQPINEDLRRQPDQLNDYQDPRLLEEISVESRGQSNLKLLIRSCDLMNSYLSFGFEIPN